ncbi:MAG: DinB family protein [Acidimicrobiia bacterium]
METRETPKTGSGKDMLLAMLDNNRAIMVWKLAGLTREQASRPVVASGTSLLGMVKHLAYVEGWWFDDFFAGNDVEYPWSEGDPDADFRIEEDETIESVIALYEAAIARAKEITADAQMDDLSVRDRNGERRALRWIVAHMIEETARHAGHADIVRELIDETTGYYPE